MRSSESLRGQLRGRLGAHSGLVLWLPAWVLPAVIVVFTVAVYQSPLNFTVDVGSPQDQAYMRNFHSRVTEWQDTER